jgi:predicted lipoprotein
VRDSVAAQGLTALERLLYDGDSSVRLLKAPGRPGEWRTEIGLGIARNLASIAKDVLAEWTAPDGVRAAIAANKGWKMIFADTAEAASLLLTEQVTAFRLMHDIKLLAVMGASADVARPRVAEAWRSGRSQRDLKLNLESAQAMTRVWAETVPVAHRTKFESLYAAALKAVDAVPADLGEAAADPRRRPLVESARAGIKAVQVELAADLGVTLGFNSLDGD